MPEPFAPTRCFLVTVLPLVRVGLRRYQGLHEGWNCGPRHRHEATVWLPEPVEQALDVHKRTFSPSSATVPADDPRWPTTCEQGEKCSAYLPHHLPLPTAYAFQPEDGAIVIHERLGRREDTGETVLAYFPPVGGVVHLDYLVQRGADGRCLGVGTPDGLWYIDVPGRAGEAWTRTGEGAAITTRQTAGPSWRWRIVEGMLEEVR